MPTVLPESWKSPSRDVSKRSQMGKCMFSKQCCTEKIHLYPLERDLS